MRFLLQSVVLFIAHLFFGRNHCKRFHFPAALFLAAFIYVIFLHVCPLLFVVVCMGHPFGMYRTSIPTPTGMLISIPKTTFIFIIFIHRFRFKMLILCFSIPYYFPIPCPFRQKRAFVKTLSFSTLPLLQLLLFVVNIPFQVLFVLL